MIADELVKAFQMVQPCSLISALRQKSSGAEQKNHKQLRVVTNNINVAKYPATKPRDKGCLGGWRGENRDGGISWVKQPRFREAVPRRFH